LRLSNILAFGRCLGVASPIVTLGGCQVRPGILVVGIEAKGVASELAYSRPLASAESLLGLVQEAVDLTLDAFARHVALAATAAGRVRNPPR